MIYLKDYKVPNYKVEKLDLDFDLHDSHAIVQSETIYYKNPDSKENNTLKLDGEELEILSIYLDNKKLEKIDYKIVLGDLIIKNTPNKFILKIKTKIYPQKNTRNEGLYTSNQKFCTQCEPEGFRRITYYLDRPDVMTKFTTKITADQTKYPVLLSNGNKIKEGKLDNNKHYVKWYDPFAKPSYLFALIAGDLEHIEDNYITKSGRKVILRIFTESHNISKTHFAMESLKKSMKWDEDRFGLEYDLDLYMIVAVDDFNMGAMENKGLNVFNSKYVFASPETATDEDYSYIERVIAHEYFHNWTGNRITCRDWFQLSLKEGLTVFRDGEFTADMNSRAVKRIDDVRYLKNSQFKEDAGPMAHPVRPSAFEEINNFYTITIYEKGSEVIRMYQTILGVEGFRKGMDLYFKRHDGEAVTTEDFLSAMGDANNIDLSQFQTWYNQAGTPVVNVGSKYDKKLKKYTLLFEQSCPKTPEQDTKKPFIIPIKFGLIKEDGKEIKLDNDLIILTKNKQSFEFKNIDSKVIPSLLRDFSAPVTLKYDYTYDDYAFLMRYDNDPFNKFEACQNFAKSILLKIISSGKISVGTGLVESVGTGFKPVPTEFIQSLRSILEDDNLDNALKAELMIMPSETEMANIISKGVNPLKIHKSRKFLLNQIATGLKDIFEKNYHDLKKDYKITPEDIGDRSLKNVCLIYLTYAIGSSLAYSQYQNSDNMTDTMASLYSLSDFDCDERTKALDDFYNTWKDNTNVIDKWFSIQATSRLENTLEVVKKLTSHKLFNIKNPNKIYALFSAFASANQVIFNRKDGEGYKFIADRVIEIDKFNPMVAARLARSLIGWKNLEEKLSKKLKAQLLRISEIKNLSGDLREVVDKGLV